MCTVSFVPHALGGYWLGCNRDERLERAEAEAPTVRRNAARTLLAPRDPDGGGSWIAVDEQGLCLCLLNGDRLATGSLRDDAPSRGLLLLELAVLGSAQAIANELRSRRAQQLLQENPFRLLVAQPATGATDAAQAKLMRLGWDGRQLEVEELPAPHLEVSHGLDQPRARQLRSDSFASLQQRTGEGLSADELRSWHRRHLDDEGVGDEYSVCMHHSVARTVSFTAVQVTPDQVQMEYVRGYPCRQSTPVPTALPRSTRP